MGERKLKNRLYATAMITAIALSATGCSGKKVEYDADTQNASKDVISSLKDIDTDKLYSDDFTVSADIGEVKVEIAAKAEVPESDTMSVMEVEQIPLTTELKEKVLKAYFGDSQIYYYDMPHRTKTELQNMIDYLAEHDGYEDGDTNSQSLIKEYTSLLETAKDEWTPATEYDSSNVFVGKKGDTWYKVEFTCHNKEGILDEISAFPIEGYVKKAASDLGEYSEIYNDGYIDQYYGPQSLKMYDTVDDVTDETAVETGIGDASDNESKITVDEAEKTVDKFIQSIGMEAIILTEKTEMKWKGYNEKSDNKYQPEDIHKCTDGYRFSYNAGIDNVIFNESINSYLYGGYAVKHSDNEEENTWFYEDRMFCVNKYGVSEFYINSPVSVVRKQTGVELLPADKIFEIMRAELKANGNNYVMDQTVKYNTLTLGYIRVKDQENSKKASYIPVWSLELAVKEDIRACPVWVNAIDGTIIKPEDI